MEMTAVEKKLNEYFDKYVPMSGMAPTVGGEIVRAIERLMYRWWNDGDMVGEGYGNETCNGSYRYLYDIVPNFPDRYDYREYDDFLKDASSVVLNYLEDNSDIFEKENTEDSRTALPEDYVYAQEEDDDWYESDYEEYDEERI